MRWVSVLSRSLLFIPRKSLCSYNTCCKQAKRDFVFVFTFCYPWHQQNLRPSERTKSILLMMAKVLFPCGLVVVIMKFDLDPQFDQSPCMRGREFSYSRRPCVIPVCSRLSALACGPACLSHWTFSKGHEQKVPGVWSLCPTIFGHP